MYDVSLFSPENPPADNERTTARKDGTYWEKTETWIRHSPAPLGLLTTDYENATDLMAVAQVVQVTESVITVSFAQDTCSSELTPESVTGGQYFMCGERRFPLAPVRLQRYVWDEADNDQYIGASPQALEPGDRVIIRAPASVFLESLGSASSFTGFQ